MVCRPAAMALGVLAAVLGTMAMAAEPATRAAGGPRTYHDVYRETLEYNRKSMVAAYRTDGGHDAKWDAPAVESLERLARQFTAGSVPGTLYTPEVPEDAATVGRLARQAIDLGCEDPMVLYASIVNPVVPVRAEDVRAQLTKVIAAFESSKYDRLRLFAALHRMYEMSSDGTSRLKLRQRMDDLVPELVSGPFLNDGARMLVYSQVLELVHEKLPAAMRERTVRQAEKAPRGDVWIVRCLRARLEIKLAWDDRGSGWGNEVTPEGWRGFEQHLAQARTAAREAHAANPRLPHAACAMITIAMGQSESAEVKSWFKKAIEAQLDYIPAYDAVLGALQPRWGGSFEEMLEVGLEAARTRRYDTETPWQYIRSVADVAKDGHGGGSMVIWNVPDIRKQAVEVLEGYESYHNGKPTAAAFYGHHAALEYICKNNRRARELLDRVPGQVPPTCFGGLGLSASASIEKIYLETFADQEAMNEIYRAESRGRPAEVVELLAKAMAKIDPKERMHEILALRKGVEELRVAYDSGEWVSLIRDRKLPAWYIDSPVGVNEKVLVTRGGGARFKSTSRLRLPDRRYEIQMKFRITERTLEPRAWFGLEFGLEEDGFGVFLSAVAPEQLVVRAPGSMQGRTTARAAENTEIRVVYFDGVPEVTVNESKIQFPVSPDVDLAALPPSNRLRFGGLYSDGPCAGVQITELKIRRLTERPK